jgi:hypothetical protein
MAGLLDLLQNPDAQLGMQLLAAGGYSPTPMSAGQRISGALQNFQAQQDASVRRASMIAQAQREQAINGLIVNRLGSRAGGAGAGAPGAGQPAGGVPSMPMGGAGVGAAGAGPAPGPMGAGVAQSSGAGQGAGSSFPFTMDDLALLSTAGAKNAGDLFNMYKYVNDGVKREAGNYYKDPVTGATSYMPKIDNGMDFAPDGSIRPARGYVSANAAIKGTEAGATTAATEAAKYPYTVGADRQRQTTQAALDTQPVVGEDGNTYYVPRLQVATGGAGGGGPAGAGGAPGQGGGFMAGRNPITQQSATSLNDNWIKNAYQPTLDAGKSASDISANIQALRNIDMNTGWGTEAKASGAAMLEGLGIAPANAKLFASNSQKFQSVAMEKLMTTLSAQKGMQTEGDADRAGKTFVALKNTPEANAFIMDFAQAKANMDQRRAQYYEAALPLAQKAGDLTRVDREWRKVQGSIWADPTLQRWSK